jgi:hypothetical protein
MHGISRAGGVGRGKFEMRRTLFIAVSTCPSHWPSPLGVWLGQIARGSLGDDDIAGQP